MVGVFYVLNLALALSAFVNSCTDSEQASQNFYNIKYIQVPLLLNHVANYTREAEAAIQLYKQVPSGHVLQGLTKMLRPYRVQVNNISRTLSGGPARECASSDTVADISSTTSALLPDSAREIVNLYMQSYSECSNQTIEKLQNKLSDLAQLEVTLKDTIVQGGTVNDIKDLLFSLLRKVNTEGTLSQDVTDVLSFSTFDKDLLIVPMCLFYSLIDAAQVANSILRQISSCASKAGVAVSIQVVTDPELSLNVPTVLASLLTYYDITRQTSLCQSDLYVMIQYLYYEAERSRNELSQNESVESVLEGNEKLKRILTLTAESTNITIKTCVDEAYKYSRADVAQKLTTRERCQADSLAQTLQLQASFKATYLELGSDYLSRISGCIVTNLLNASDLVQCTTSILSQLKQTLVATCDAYDRSVVGMLEYFGMQKSCSLAEISLEQVYNCDKKLFAFIVDLDSSFIR